MRLKQLSILLLAVSISAPQPVGLIAMSTKPQAKGAEEVAQQTRNIKEEPGKFKKIAKKAPSKGIKRKKKQKKEKKGLVAKQGKFDTKGGAKSFKESADYLMNHMKSIGSTSKVEDKNALWASLARFYHYTEQVKAYNTKECNQIALNLFQEAARHKDLFSKSRMWLIEKWVKQKQDFISGKRVPEKKPAVGAKVEKRVKVKKGAEKPMAKKLPKQKQAFTPEKREPAKTTVGATKPIAKEMGGHREMEER